MLTDSNLTFFEEPPHKHYERVPVRPEDSRRCVRVIAENGGHKCQVNTIMHEVFDVVGYDKHYVGRSQDDDELDLLTWRSWLRGMRVM